MAFIDAIPGDPPQPSELPDSGSLYMAQKQLRGFLEKDVKAAWNPKGVSFNLPDSTPDEKCAKDSLPAAFVLLRGATASEDDGDGGSFCAEPVVQLVEVSLRECRPRRGEGDVHLLHQAQKLREKLGLRLSTGIYHDWPVRWVGETYIEPDSEEGTTPEYSTLRIQLRFVLEVSLS